MARRTKSDAVEAVKPAGGLIIFDFDGVIMDSLPVQFEIYKELAREMNFTDAIHDFDKYLSSRELPGDIFSADYRHTLREVGISTPERIKEAEQRYLKHIARLRHKIKPFPFISSLLAQLSQGYTLAIASNNNESEIRRMLARHNLDAYFSGIFAPPSHPGLKPRPDQLIACMKELGFPPQKTLFIGDMDGDIVAARAAGIKCVAVTWGFHSKKKLEGSDFIAETPEELLDIIHSLFGPNVKKSKTL